MLRGEGNAGERWKTTISLISKKATLHVQHTFLYISLPLFCTTTTWNFQKLLSYTFFSFTFFFSLPLIFTLHWWPLAFPILSPPLPNRYKSEKTRPVKRARESGEDEDYEAPPPSPLPSPSLCSLRSPISFQFHPVFCLFPPLRSLVPG